MYHFPLDFIIYSYHTSLSLKLLPLYASPLSSLHLYHDCFFSIIIIPCIVLCSKTSLSLFCFHGIESRNQSSSSFPGS